MGKLNELFIPILTITWSLLNIPFAFPISGDSELRHICDLPGSSGQEFNGNFTTSRWFTAYFLSDYTASNGGYQNTSYSVDSEMSYGQALCRGDISDGNCTECLKKATNTLINTTDHCPNSRSGIIWHHYCVFKYSDTDFLGKVDTDNSRSLRSDNGWDQGDVVQKLLRDLIPTAIQNSQKKFYASGNATLGRQIGDSGKVYGMVQCTRDLTQDDCVYCLNFTLSSVPANYESAQVLRGSCNVRFEIYNFLNS